MTTQAPTIKVSMLLLSSTCLAILRARSETGKAAAASSTTSVVYKMPLSCGAFYTGRCVNEGSSKQNEHPHLAAHCRECTCYALLTGTSIVYRHQGWSPWEIVQEVVGGALQGALSFDEKYASPAVSIMHTLGHRFTRPRGEQNSCKFAQVSWFLSLVCYVFLHNPFFLKECTN